MQEMTNDQYAKARNKLIPFAMAYADKNIEKQPFEGQHRYAQRWNLAFLSEMERLARISGLSVDLSTIPRTTKK
jgi:hypothetical protein